MEIFVYAGLTALNIIAILIRRRKRKLSLKRYVYRQSTLHQIAKLILPTNAELIGNKISQHKKHIDSKTVRVLTTPEHKAYWVKDNKFYWADVENGEFNPELGTEISTESLSKKEIEKLLFILDNLNKGNENDSGSSRNK